MKNNPTPEHLATIAAHFIAAGKDQDVALDEANTLYFAATRYLRNFNAMTPIAQAMYVGDEKSVQELLRVGGVPALEYFRKTATTKTERNISEKAFVNLIERECSRLPESIAPEVLMALHHRLRARRSAARKKRRKKSVK